MRSVPTGDKDRYVGVSRYTRRGMQGGSKRGILPVSGIAALALAAASMGGLSAQRASLAAVVAEAERSGYRTGVAVRDLGNASFSYQYRAAEAFIPASNQKILTVAAALWGLGAGFRYRTVFKLRDGLLEVHPGGDPNWLSGSAHDPAKVFGELAGELRRRGITRLAGVRRLAGPFTGDVRPAGWPRDQFDRLYCAPTGGLVLDAASFSARISAAGSQARIELLAPPARVRFRTGIKTTSKKRKSYSYWISQSKQGFAGHGVFYARARPVTVRGVAQQPGWLFEQTLRTVLGRQGITVGNRLASQDSTSRPLARAARPASTGSKAVAVYTHWSSLRESLAPILKDSSNFHAEQLLRVIGARCSGDGSFAGGCAILRAQLATRVKLPASLRIVDGSGLARGNQVTPNLLVEVMAELCDGPHSRLFVENLARGGKDGTLRRRFRKNPAVGAAVHAKTGTINGVKSLSGIVRTRAGKLRLFSILMNRRKGTSTRGASALQERMVEAIYRGR